jgi:cytochrome c oxidase subunit 2
MCDHHHVLSPLRPDHRLVLFGVAAMAALSLVLGACSGTEDDAAGPQVELSATGELGRQIAQDQGCMSCHREQGAGGIGPSWAGLAGSEVELDDGTVVVADEEYLTRAINEPNAQIVKGYNGIMPERSLDPDEVAAIVAYLQEL